MKRAVEIFFRWLIIIAVSLAVYQMAKAQNCCSFELVRKDTILEKGIFVIEPKAGERARITFEPIPVTTAIIDNVSPLMIYVGAWANGGTTATGFQQNTIAWSNTIGNTITFSFTGKRLEWFSEYKTTHGRASVTVNGIEKIINLGSANTGPGIVAEWNLPQGNYTVMIKVLDAKPVVHDSWRVTQ